MEYIELRDLLSAKNLDYSDLNLLKPDSDRYSTLLIQPSPNIIYDDFKVKNSDEQQIQYYEFLKLCLDQNSDLCLSPEYSTPISVLDRCLEESIVPNQKKLWILGLESITPIELTDFKNKTRGDVEVILPRELDTSLGNFLDPLVYIFRAKNTENNELKTIVAFQFKTYPMGGDTFERDNLIRGDYVYILRRNVEHSVKVITLLCSDVLNGELRIRDEVGSTLLIHLQLNTAPRHQSYSEYRRSIWDLADDKTEIISLNWAENFIFNLSETNENISGSCIYTKSNQIDLSDTRIRGNHGRGLYFTYEPKYRVFQNYINYRPGLYLLSNTKPSQIAANVTQSGRSGPRVENNFEWEVETSSWIRGRHPLSSGVVEEVQNYPELMTLYNTLNGDCLKFERILSLTLGKKITDERWYFVKNMESFQINQDEIIKRVSFCQDKDTLSVNNRIEIFLKMNNFLVNFSKTGNVVPANMIGLMDNGFIEYHDEEPHYNLFNVDDEKGTVIYLGEVASDHVKKVYNEVYEILCNSKLDFKRLVVLYINENIELDSYYNKSVGDLDFIEDDSTNSITRME